MAPLISVLPRHGVEACVCLTAQHRQMLDQVLGIFGIQAEFDLDLMRPQQTLFSLTSRVVAEMEPVLAASRPDIVLVQGDTTTAFTAALAAFYAQIPVGHVEAGLRTYQKYSPFPEEVNRKLITSLADLHFAPTTRSRDALLAEGVDPSAITVTGNTAIDALLMTLELLDSGRASTDIIQRLNLHGKRFILVTAHRRESFGKEFENICTALATLAQRHPDMEIVYPVHLNPCVQKPVRAILSGLDRIHLIEPLDYVSFVALLRACTFILTDSGGIQEEAPSLGKPVLVMRQVTERVEAIDAGVARLVGTNTDTIVQEAERVITDPDYFRTFVQANPYGDGTAAQNIASALIGFARQS